MTGIAKQLRKDMEKKIKEGLGQLETKFEVRIKEMEQTLGKRIDAAEDRMSKKIDNDLEKMKKEEAGKRDQLIQTVKASLAKKKGDLKEEVLREIEENAFFLRRSHAEDYDPELSHLVQPRMSDDPELSHLVQPRMSDSFGRAANIHTYVQKGGASHYIK